MKLRTPGRLSAALNEIKTKLTERKCAEIVGRSESLIRKWADPDDRALPNIQHCLLLDTAYVRAGFGEPPIHGWLTLKLDTAVIDDPKDMPNILVATLNVQARLGEIASLVARFSRDGRINANDVSENERAALVGAVENLAIDLEKIERSLLDDMAVPGPISAVQAWLK